MNAPANLDPAHAPERGSSTAEAVDLEGFFREVRELRGEILDALGPEDIAHLKKIEGWGRKATAVGLACAWLGPNPVSIVGLSLGRSTRWLLMHHIGHCGYDRVPGIEARYTSRVFARGKRRIVDWYDWMTPESWCHAHNTMHHAFTGENADPDQIEHNMEMLEWLPRPLKKALFGSLVATWRPSYFAPKATWSLLSRRGRPRLTEVIGKVLVEGWLPNAALHFVALPALFAPLGPLAVASAFLNSVGADLLTNAHTFLVVGPTHIGDDLYRFDDRAASKEEHLWRQVVGTSNYATGGDVNDLFHLWINYQIEHHLFPDVPMYQYRRIQPEVRALCERYGIPYRQESVLRRFEKMARVFIGDATMPRWRSGRRPRQGEPQPA